MNKIITAILIFLGIIFSIDSIIYWAGKAKIYSDKIRLIILKGNWKPKYAKIKYNKDKTVDYFWSNKNFDKEFSI